MNWGLSYKIVIPVGGLGSQMMAYALTEALKSRNQNLCNAVCDFTPYHLYDMQAHNGSELNRAFGLSEERVATWLGHILHSSNMYCKLTRKILSASGIISQHAPQWTSYNYDSSVFEPHRFIVTYSNQSWTSWKYFDDIKPKIMEIFSFRPINSSDTQNINILKEIRMSNSVALHIRLSDYIGNSVLGGVTGPSYYREAIQYLSSKVEEPVFYLFSDDTEKALQLLKTCNVNYKVISWNKGVSSFRDMQLMSECAFHIIPNSSFSWWGAYLCKRRGQIVVAPKRWTNQSSIVQLRDMNLPNWKIIDNHIELIH